MMWLRHTAECQAGLLKAPDAKVWRYLVYLKYYTLNLRPQRSTLKNHSLQTISSILEAEDGCQYLSGTAAGGCCTARAGDRCSRLMVYPKVLDKQTSVLNISAAESKGRVPVPERYFSRRLLYCEGR